MSNAKVFINPTAEEIAVVRRAYQNEWRANNKDKVKQYNTNYWTKKAAELKEKNAFCAHFTSLFRQI